MAVHTGIYLFLPVIVATASLAGCGVQSRSKAQFAGTLKSTTPACPQTSGSLVLRDDEIVFAPTDGTWVLSGKLMDGRVDIQRSRPNANGKPYTVTFRATLTPQRVEGTYTTPFCAYDVALQRF